MLILRRSPLILRNAASISGLSWAGAVSFSSGECSRISGTTRLMNLSSISIRLFLNGFSKTLSTKVAFAWLPASSRANATIGVLSG